MRVLAVRGASLFVVSFLSQSFGSLGIGGIAPAQAQAIPKSIEEGGTDNVLKVKKNHWTVGIAGGQLSGTHLRP